MEKGEKQKAQQEMIELHPCEFLMKLNSIHSNCNKTGSKSYSCASKIKLPWKPFNIIKIPDYFHRTYEIDRKTAHKETKEHEVNADGLDKKLWREHQEVLKKHAANKGVFKKTFRPKTAYKERKAQAQSTLRKTNLQHNFFLQRIVEKGGQFTYDRQELKEEIIRKLSKMGSQKCTAVKTRPFMKSSHTRGRSVFTKTNKNMKTLGQPEENWARLVSKSPVPEKFTGVESRQVHQAEFLCFQNSEVLLGKYKENIRQVESSISHSNVRKTVGLLQSLQNIADGLT